MWGYIECGVHIYVSPDFNGNLIFSHLCFKYCSNVATVLTGGKLRFYREAGQKYNYYQNLYLISSGIRIDLDNT